MAKFSYQAVNLQSQYVKGVLTADSLHDASTKLSEKGLQIVELDEFVSESKSGLRHGRLKQEDVITALLELATMLNGGVSIAESVDAQSDSGHHPNITNAFAQVAKKLKQGGTFSDSLESTQLNLPKYLFQLLKAGELSGNLGPALADGVSQMSYDLKLKNEMKNALVYPSILIFSGILAVGLLFIFVVPKFAGLLDNADQIPFLGYVVLAGGNWANENWPILVGALVALFFGVTALLKNESFNNWFLDFASKLPVIGPWLVEAEIASWSKVLSALLSNRVSLIEALWLSGKSINIPYRALKMSEVVKEVKAGEPLSSALEQNQVITTTGCNLVRVGERSGELPSMLNSLADLYSEKSKNRMTRVLAMIEPIAILIIGSVVGVIIMGIVLAITSANEIAV